MGNAAQSTQLQGGRLKGPHRGQVEPSHRPSHILICEHIQVWEGACSR
ncbi:hypothetical protein C4K02_4805 [Pseudomonas synxantha]|nr:hypothetical protein C4K02_4805 [Pseudomonas synxantha]